MTSPETILVLDIGTSALKATLYTRAGRLLAQGSSSYGYVSPEPNSAEADPDDWWRAVPLALVAMQANLKGVCVIGLTGQMHSAVLLNADHTPIKPCLLWLDRRCASEAVELGAALNLPPYHLNSTYTLPKLMWLARHRPNVLAQAKILLFPKDYVRYKLTGILTTDVSEAGGASLLDWHTRQWAPERLRFAKLDERILPRLCESEQVIGCVLPSVAEALGLPRAAQVIVGVGDVAAILGGAPIEPARVMAAVGTSSMVYAVLPEALREVRDENDGIYPYDLCGYRLLGGVSSLAGGALDWAWRAFGAASGQTFDEAMQVVAQIEPGANGLVFVPYLAGERSPFWRDDLRGMFVGLNVAHTWLHMLRAVVEGVAFSQRLVLDRFARLGMPSPRVALSGGIAQYAIWSRIIADSTQRTLELYQTSSAASNVVYALCAQVLEPGLPFGEAMNRAFEPPRLVEPNHELASRYDDQYACYRYFVDSALARR